MESGETPVEHQTEGVGMSTDLQEYITRQPQLGLEPSLPYCLHPQTAQASDPKAQALHPQASSLDLDINQKPSASTRHEVPHYSLGLARGSSCRAHPQRGRRPRRQPAV